MEQRHLRSFGLFLRSILPGLVFVAFTGHAEGLSPESPEVQRLVQRAAKYLESPSITDSRVGGKALVGLAFLKQGDGPEHPKVAEAISYIQSKLDSAATRLDWDIYSTGIALMFLVECDPGLYRREIDTIANYLVAKQKSHGGWGYSEKSTGDTSMTQYGVLSAWEMAQVGIRLPFSTVEGVAAWLLKTQDPTGAFGYQGKVSPSFQPVEQEEIRHSMVAAGLGSVYICYDLLGFNKRSENNNGLPPAMKPVERSSEPEWPPSKLDSALVRAAMERGNQWMQSHYCTPDKAEGFRYYYLYALERYHSFRELAEGKVDPDPVWYNDGVAFLAQTEEKVGGWAGNDSAGRVPNTAFGILFLLRSSKKSIERARGYGAGTLIGGRGLPKFTDMVQVRDGQVIATPEIERTEKLLAALEKGGAAMDPVALESLADLPAEEARALVSKHGKALRDLAGGVLPEARVAAVRALSRTGTFDQAPLLIYALGDADRAVVLAASDGLRRISRKIDTPELPDEYNAEQLRQEIQQWKAWYRAIRPDAEFEN